MTYLDHAATTPVRPEVLEAVAEQASRPGNASSLHTSGRAARRVVEESRERIAELLGARPSEVVFTSGGTEGDNLAVLGAYRSAVVEEPQRRRVVVSTIEHHAVLDAVEHLVEHEGAQVSWVACDAAARVTPDALRTALGSSVDDVALAAVMWANNEVGTVQPVAALTAVCREVAPARRLPFHTDAVQAIGSVPVDFAASGADTLALTGHKLGGPHGVGALLVRRDAVLQPLSFGGGQERQLRSGTLDVPGIRGLAVALELAVVGREEHSRRVGALRDDLVRRVQATVPGVVVSGIPTPGDVAQHLAGTVHLVVPGADGDSLLYLLDAEGVEVSTGSACQAGVPQPSHVVLAMGVPAEDARGTLRISLGHSSTQADVDHLAGVLPTVVERARRARERRRRP